MRSVGYREEVHRHSGWVLPVAVLFFLLLLSGLWLGWYLRPGPTALTGRSTIVKVVVRGTPLLIPANYIDSPQGRAGGPVNSIRLAALFPSWRGYSDAEARLFASNAPDSPVVRLSLRGDSNSLDEGERLDRIYMPYIANPGGERGPFGLTHYGFVRDSGYENSDLFKGESAQGLALFLCERPSPQFLSPNCLAIDRRLAPDLSLSYRFKRAYLARWQEISAGVQSLVARFEAGREG